MTPPTWFTVAVVSVDLSNLGADQKPVQICAQTSSSIFPLSSSSLGSEFWSPPIHQVVQLDVCHQIPHMYPCTQ